MIHTCVMPDIPVSNNREFFVPIMRVPDVFVHLVTRGARWCDASTISSHLIYFPIPTGCTTSNYRYTALFLLPFPFCVFELYHIKSSLSTQIKPIRSSFIQYKTIDPFAQTLWSAVLEPSLSMVSWTLENSSIFSVTPILQTTTNSTGLISLRKYRPL